ncbi:MAG: C39 family peptidase [Chloroflexi bacterium]|nr:C39 family peptidase [Chloroflexota bacterium]
MMQNKLSWVLGLVILGAAIVGLWSFMGGNVLASEPAILETDLTASITMESSQPERAALSTPTPFLPVMYTATPTATATATATPTATSTPTPTATPTLPASANIYGIYGRWSAYSLDCESRSAVDWAGYFGVAINEITFFNSLPVSDNPDRGFVGNVHAPWGQIPPSAYGVHARPVAKLLRKYGLDAGAVKNMSWDALRTEITAGRPVIVWVIGHVERGTPVPYTSSDGHTTTVARFQHTVIVTGYSANSVTIVDGAWVYSRSKNDFLRSWGVLGNMAVIMGK